MEKAFDAVVYEVVWKGKVYILDMDRLAISQYPPCTTVIPEDLAKIHDNLVYDINLWDEYHYHYDELCKLCIKKAFGDKARFLYDTTLYDAVF